MAAADASGGGGGIRSLVVLPLANVSQLSMVVLANVGWTLAYAKAYAERSNGIAYLAVDPIWDAIRGDPRFQDFLRRARLRQ
jgi:hypothetical protein